MVVRPGGRPRVDSGVFRVNHLWCVSACMCSKKDGNALLPKRRHCAMVHSALGGRHVKLALLCTGLTSSRWLVATSSCVHFFVYNNMLCNCVLRELYRLPTCHHSGGSDPSSSTLRSQALMTWLRPARQSPTTRVRPSGHGSKRRAACAPRRARHGVLFQPSAALRCLSAWSA